MAVTRGIDAARERSAVVREALETALRAHDGQERDDGCGPRPFAEHVLAVADQLAGDGYRDAVIAAGLLHDTIESGGLDPDRIRADFGEEIARLVDAMSERPDIEAREERKDDLRRRVSEAGRDAQAIYAADKLANVRALREGYAVRGEGVDEALDVSLDEKIQTWESDLEMLFEESADAPVVDRLADTLAGLWGERAAAAR